MAKETAKNSKDKKQCFVIGPIGGEGSEIRDEADWFLWMVTPVLQELEFEVKRADQISEPGLISEQVINMAIDADLAVADLTDHNANAFYELAIRHGTGKPVIHMIRADQKPPFDVADFRAIPYSRQHPSKMEKARQDLREQIAAVMHPDYKGGNPITRARGAKQLLASGDEKDQIVAGLVGEVRELKRRVEKVDGLSPELEAQLVQQNSFLNMLRQQENLVDVRNKMAHRVNTLSPVQSNENELARRYAEKLEKLKFRGNDESPETSKDPEDDS